MSRNSYQGGGGYGGGGGGGYGGGGGGKGHGPPPVGGHGRPAPPKASSRVGEGRGSDGRVGIGAPRSTVGGGAPTQLPRPRNSGQTRQQYVSTFLSV